MRLALLEIQQLKEDVQQAIFQRKFDLGPRDLVYLLENGHIYSTLETSDATRKSPPQPCHVLKEAGEIRRLMRISKEVNWFPCIQGNCVLSEEDVEFESLLTKLESNSQNFAIQFYNFLKDQPLVTIGLVEYRFGVSRYTAKKILLHCISEMLLVKTRDGYSANKDCKLKLSERMREIVKRTKSDQPEENLDDELRNLISPPQGSKTTKRAE